MTSFMNNPLPLIGQKLDRMRPNEMLAQTFFFLEPKKLFQEIFFLPSCLEAPIMQMGLGKCMWEPGVLLLFLLLLPLALALV